MMKVLSVNISESQTIVVNGKEEQTGYFKKSVDQSIFLGETDVKNDVVIDRIHHGGIDKACYLYGFNHYEFWKKQFPDLNFKYGMFGENITLSNLNESELKIGDVFQIGSATIQISQPRQPCYKMGIKFNDQNIVKQFRLANNPGIYVRILNEGFVTKNDKLVLINSNKKAQTVAEIYRIIYHNKPEIMDIEKAINNPFLAQKLKDYLANKFLNK